MWSQKTMCGRARTRVRAVGSILMVMLFVLGLGATATDPIVCDGLCKSTYQSCITSCNGCAGRIAEYSDCNARCPSGEPLPVRKNCYDACGDIYVNAPPSSCTSACDKALVECIGLPMLQQCHAVCDATHPACRDLELSEHEECVGKCQNSYVPAAMECNKISMFSLYQWKECYYNSVDGIMITNYQCQANCRKHCPNNHCKTTCGLNCNRQCYEIMDTCYDATDNKNQQKVCGLTIDYCNRDCLSSSS